MRERGRAEGEAVRGLQRGEVLLLEHLEVQGPRGVDAADDGGDGPGQGGDVDGEGLPEGDHGLVDGRVGVGEEHEGGGQDVADAEGGKEGVRDGGVDGAAGGAGVEDVAGGVDADEVVYGGDLDGSALGCWGPWCAVLPCRCRRVGRRRRILRAWGVN